MDPKKGSVMIRLFVNFDAGEKDCVRRFLLLRDGTMIVAEDVAHMHEYFLYCRMHGMEPGPLRRRDFEAAGKIAPNGDITDWRYHGPRPDGARKYITSKKIRDEVQERVRQYLKIKAAS